MLGASAVAAAGFVLPVDMRDLEAESGYRSTGGQESGYKSTGVESTVRVDDEKEGIRQ